MPRTNRSAQSRDRLAPSDGGRRGFVVASAAIGLAAVAAPSIGAGPATSERDVEIRTPDGTCEAAYFAPAGGGAVPGVLVWPDAFGLRPVFRTLGRRLAAQGYAVLVPNPFHRVARASAVPDAATFDWGKAADRARIQPLMASIGAPGAAERDAAAFLEFLEAQPEMAKDGKFGVQGYCMGGPLMMRTAAAFAKRVGAGASFHGGGLVTDKPTSPHLLAPSIRARLYFGVAASDDAREPDGKDRLREALQAAKVRAEIEVYPGTLHGWCMSDQPPRDGIPVHDEAAAERAWGKLLALYRESLA